MEEQLISFETAKLAKEKGFNIRCKDAYCDFEEQILYDYHHGDEELIEKRYNILVSSDYDCGKTINYYVPTQSLLQKWLREKYKIDVFVDYAYMQPFRYSAMLHNNGELNSLDGFTIFNSYEEAFEEGLFEAIKLI